jgi:hypothetical protein
MSSISVFVSECNEPGRLDRMSGSDTRPFTSPGADPRAISFLDRLEYYSLNGRTSLLGAGLQEMKYRFG